MLKPTPYGLNEYIKAIHICSSSRFEKFEDYSGGGSKHGFRLFQKESDTEPCAIWVIHFEHSKKKRIYPRDFKKAPYYLGVSEEEFESVIKKL
ncbi:MAG: hypothetical protein AAB699_00185 [Patescibacteria group bacterium]